MWGIISSLIYSFLVLCMYFGKIGFNFSKYVIYIHRNYKYTFVINHNAILNVSTTIDNLIIVRNKFLYEQNILQLQLLNMCRLRVEVCQLCY